MQVWENKYKREGLVGTIIVHVALLLIFIFAGLEYPIPKPEQGIKVNFGTTETGSGDTQPENVGQSQQVNEQPVKEETTPPEPQPETTPVEEEVVTQDNTETIEVPEETEEQTTETEKPTETEETEKPKEPVEEEEPEISEELNSALDKFKNAKENTGGSEGDDENAVGDKGQVDGTDGEAYSGGGGGNGNYALGNRKALTKPKPLYDCNEEGKVVVDIKVDRNGNTVDADVGKGTTNSADCLTKRAIQAALKTKWQANPDAPFEQRGSITYTFIQR
jgi:outer membrane biosynthesis protein TonB